MRRGSKCTLSATTAAVHMLKCGSYLCKKALKVRDLFIIAFLGVVSGTQRHKNPAEADSLGLHLLLQECASVQEPLGTILKTLLLHKDEHTESKPESTLDKLWPRKPSFKAVYLAKKNALTVFFFSKENKKAQRKLFSETCKKDCEDLVL